MFKFNACIAGLLLAVLATPAAAAGAPIRLSLAWVGEPCNAGGRVEVTVTNSGAREIAAPERAYVGFGGVFLGVAQARGGTRAMSDNMLPPMPPPPPPADGSNELRYPVRLLAPGQSTRYPAEVGTADTMFLGSPHFALETAYAEVRTKGGEVWLVYALSRAPDAFAPYVTVSLKDDPLVESNRLSCP